MAGQLAWWIMLRVLVMEGHHNGDRRQVLHMGCSCSFAQLSRRSAVTVHQGHHLDKTATRTSVEHSCQHLCSSW